MAGAILYSRKPNTFTLHGRHDPSVLMGFVLHHFPYDMAKTSRPLVPAIPMVYSLWFGQVALVSPVLACFGQGEFSTVYTCRLSIQAPFANLASYLYPYMLPKSTPYLPPLLVACFSRRTCTSDECVHASRSPPPAVWLVIYLLPAVSFLTPKHP